MINKIKNNKAIVIIAVVLLCAILVIIMRPKVLQHKWTNQVIDALLDTDEQRMVELLKDKDKDINLKGRSIASRERPLTVACQHWQIAPKYVRILLKNGAKVDQEDYEEVVGNFNNTSYEKIKLMLGSGVKPKLIFDSFSDTILDYIVMVGSKYKKNLSKKEWEELVLKSFKLVYYNAEPFDKKPVLESALDSAKFGKNKLVQKFIESELAKLDNK